MDWVDLTSDPGGTGGISEDDALQIELCNVEEELGIIVAQIRELTEKKRGLEERKSALLHVLHPKASVDDDVSNSIAQNRKSSASIDWNGTNFPWFAEVEHLKKKFEISDFRLHQRAVINATLSKKDCFVVMPTGGGKSLCFQLPGLVNPGITLVVSPLLALMQDQVMILTELGIGAARLTGSGAAAKAATQQVYMDMADPKTTLKFIYATPEKLVKSKTLMSKLEKLDKNGRLARIVIDEVHCCSAWGHDFRPDYRKLGVLKQQFPRVPVLALTATATKQVITDVKDILNIRSCEFFRSPFNRPNLVYEVREKLSSVADDMAAFIKTHYKTDSGIVYCFSRNESQTVAEELRARNIKAEHYHANMDPEEREKIQEKWSKNKIQVVVATISFGLGISKPDVRFVVHHTMSKSIEGYYQESGRAGRDGKESHCLLYYRPHDATRSSTMVYDQRNGPKSVYEMMRYCTDVKKCRRVMISQYFGDALSPDECGGKCDNCRSKTTFVSVDISAHALNICEIIEGRDKRVTLLQLCDLWRGSKKDGGPVDERLRAPGDYSKKDCERILSHLLVEGVLKESFQNTAYSTNSYVVVNPPGRTALRNGFGKVLIDFPEKAGKLARKSSSQSTLADTIAAAASKAAKPDAPSSSKTPKERAKPASKPADSSGFQAFARSRSTGATPAATSSAAKASGVDVVKATPRATYTGQDLELNTELKALRKKLGEREKPLLYPLQVLSESDMGRLISLKPMTLSVVEDAIGKEKTDKWGHEILHVLESVVLGFDVDQVSFPADLVCVLATAAFSVLLVPNRPSPGQIRVTLAAGLLLKEATLATVR
eukprot:TRINITY_DN4581_c0_g1_i3.p1 TRINITY_DN4581_c0_g1~~TRINITY_DN4581_c0_g1_i3.p1  ORF type:complete len:831 (+),score=228.95 TRINITY_DN4581_c0_g1_i3:43-2535(+)